jgi:two-component system, chemotaxis family, protein-glutamate methylesterase/glutaminase
VPTDEQELTDFPLVALVCSAGGLDALTRVLQPLPADLPAAVLVLQHLSPEYPSQLAAILEQRTALRVLPADDGAALTPGTVLVAPSGQHTLIAADETIVLIASGAVPPYRPSADLLLTTLAVVAGPG